VAQGSILDTAFTMKSMKDMKNRDSNPSRDRRLSRGLPETPEPVFLPFASLRLCVEKPSTRSRRLAITS